MITKQVKRVRWKLAAHVLLFATLLGHQVRGQCFGGTETYEKTTGVKFQFGASQGILTQPGTGITRDCTAICRQTPTCAAFTVDYENSRCQSFNLDSAGHRNSLVEKVGSNFFEKICLRGVSNLNTLCGDRLWAFERVVGAFLEEFDDREERNIQTKTECEKLCLFETTFTCRSAEYDESAGICRLSREDRRSQPSAFRRQAGSSVDYLENQCVRSLPDCRYNVRQGSSVISMDELQFAASQGECEALCDQARGFSCRSFTYAMEEKRCYLSGDDSVALNSAPLISKRDAIYAEKQCSISQCEDGLFTFEKVSGHFLRSAQLVGLAMATSPGVTLECGARCLEAGADCPAFSLDYNAMKCYKLDRNTQGRGSELSPREGQSYFEKMCIRGNVRGCEGRAWAFERRPGKELRGNDDAVLTLIQSRRDCMESCLSERRFVCRSAVYDTLSATCKLSREDRRTKPGDYVDATSTTEYIENQCIPPEGRCTFKPVANSYPRYLDIVVTPVSSERDCERLCYDYSDFVCRSFSYYPSGGQCFISSDDRPSAGQEALMSRPGTQYYERECLTGVPALPGGVGGGIGGMGGGIGAMGGGIGAMGGGIGGGSYPAQGGGVGGGGGSRCNVGSAEFEKVVGYELSGRASFSLFREPLVGLSVKCTALCHADPRCHGFNLDYNRNDCVAVEGEADVTRIDLRANPGVAYFQGVCLRGPGCGLAWTFERHINQELRGFTNGQFPGVSKTECEDLCLEETSFTCRSATYNPRRRECRLSAEDRFTQPQAYQTSQDTDYIENQCATIGGRCVYRNQQRDRQLIYTDKSLSAFSDSSCQHACDVEREFSCRAYTFLSQTGQTTAQCLLSGSAGLGVNGFQTQSGALYAEKECTSSPPGVASRPGPSFPVRPGTLPLGPNPNQGFPIRPGQYPSGSGQYPSGQYPPGGGQQFPADRYPVDRYPQRPGAPPVVPDRYPPRPGGGQGDIDRYPPRPGGGQSDGDRYGPRPGLPPGLGGAGQFPTTVGGAGRFPGGGDVQPVMSAFPCRHTLTYEKVAGATYSGQRDPLRTRGDIGISSECLVLCAEQRQRCLAVSVENLRGGRQRCYALQRSADEDNAPLLAAPDLAYFQKICLTERPTCAKAWVFTRVPGYELASSTGVEVRDVATRRQCQDECLREKRVVCRAATYHARERLCKISPQTRRTQPQLFKRANPEVDYMENECAPEPPNCEYTDMPGRYLPYTDRFVPQVFDVSECKRLCDQEREFSCRSFNYHLGRRECFLGSDDTFTADRSALLQDRDYFYSEHDTCSKVRVDCTQADMLVNFNFGAGFEGRVYATGNPQACFEMGNGQAQLVLRIPMGTQCGTVQQGRGRYVNHVVIQQNPVIMQETDKTVRVECSFDASDQTVSYAPSGTREQQGGGISVTVPFKPSGTNIVTNTAPTPNVRMRIVTRKGQEAAVVGLGDELQLKIDIDPTSAFGIFVRNLEARTDNGEILTLIDNVGCPRDPNIFPALQAERGTRDLFADFKAFRFPSTATVNFVATVQFCQDVCEPIRCSSGVHSFCKRRRREIENVTESSPNQQVVVNLMKGNNTNLIENLSLQNSSLLDDVIETESLDEDHLDDREQLNMAYGLTSDNPVSMSTFPQLSSTMFTTARQKLTESTVDKKLAQITEEMSSSESNTVESTSAGAAAVSTQPTSAKRTTTKPPDAELPGELPLQLRLVVGEDTMLKPGPAKKNKYNRNYNSDLYDNRAAERADTNAVTSDDGVEYVCTSKSTVVALVLSLLIFNVGVVAGVVFLYRMRKRRWDKLERTVNQGPGPGPPEVLFRSVYGRLPGNSQFNRPILGK